MKRETNAPKTYEDVIRSVGAPNKTVTDNSQVLTGESWTYINRRYFITTGLAVPYHQHQHYCEGVGGNFKLVVIELFHRTPHAPLKYWCLQPVFWTKQGDSYLNHLLMVDVGMNN